MKIIKTIFRILSSIMIKDNFLDKLEQEERKEEKNLALIAVKANGLSLEFVFHKFKNDKDIVLTAIKQNGFALKYASEIHKKNKEIVLIAVSQNGFALKSASEDLKNDKEVVCAACIQSVAAILYVSKEIQNEIGENDPVKYLQSQKMYNELQIKIPLKEEVKKRKRKV